MILKIEETNHFRHSDLNWLSLMAWLKLMAQNAREYYDQKGFLFFLKRAFAKAGFEYFSRTLMIIKRDLKDIDTDPDEPCIFEEATPADIENVDDFNIGFFDKRKTLYRLSKGLKLFVVKQNGKIVFALWAETKNAALWWLDVPLHLPPDTLYISGIFTAREMRNKGMYTKVKDQLFPRLKKEGITHLIGTIEPRNLLSLDIHRRFGWREYQTITYQRFWHIRRYTVQKSNSGERKIFTTVCRAPRNLWSLYW